VVNRGRMPLNVPFMVPRQERRFAVWFPVCFTGDHEGEGLVTNLSIGGCSNPEM
jgi:hypothetical protein